MATTFRYLSATFVLALTAIAQLATTTHAQMITQPSVMSRAAVQEYVAGHQINWVSGFSAICQGSFRQDNTYTLICPGGLHETGKWEVKEGASGVGEFCLTRRAFGSEEVSCRTFTISNGVTFLNLPNDQRPREVRSRTPL